MKYEPCKGMNCGTTDGVSHSLECQAEHAASVAGGHFTKAAAPATGFVHTYPFGDLSVKAQLAAPAGLEEYVLLSDCDEGHHPKYGRGFFFTANCIKEPTQVAVGQDAVDAARLVEAITLLRKVYPAINPHAMDVARMTGNPASECYLNTMVREFLDRPAIAAIDAAINSKKGGAEG